MITVFPRIVSAETILFWNFLVKGHSTKASNFSFISLLKTAETIRGNTVLHFLLELSKLCTVVLHIYNPDFVWLGSEEEIICFWSIKYPNDRLKELIINKQIYCWKIPSSHVCFVSINILISNIMPQIIGRKYGSLIRKSWHKEWNEKVRT